MTDTESFCNWLKSKEQELNNPKSVKRLKTILENLPKEKIKFIDVKWEVCQLFEAEELVPVVSVTFYKDFPEGEQT